MFMDEVEKSMTIDEQVENYKNIGVDAREMVKESQELIDAIDDSDRDDLEDLRSELVGIRNRAEEIADKIG